MQNIQVIVKSAQQRSYKKGELLSEAGDRDNYVYFIMKGLIRIFLKKEKGDEITFGLFQEFSVYTNFDILLFGQSSRYHVQALEKTVVFRIEYDVLMRLLQENPKLARYRENIFQTILKLL